MNNHFDDKEFYTVIADKIEDERPLNQLDLAILFRALKGDERFQSAVLYIFDNASSQKEISWLVEKLNDWYLFAPIRNMSGVSGFRIEERNREVENQIERFSCILYNSQPKENV